jgi:hypothetical protein
MRKVYIYIAIVVILSSVMFLALRCLNKDKLINIEYSKEEKDRLIKQNDSLTLVITNINRTLDELESKLRSIKTQSKYKDSLLQAQREELHKRKQEAIYYRNQINKQLNETLNDINDADSSTIDSLRTKYFK